MDDRIRWGRVVLAAVLLELAISAVVLPFGLMYGNPLSATPGQPLNTTPYFVSAGVGCTVLGFLFGAWGAANAPHLHWRVYGRLASTVL